MSKSDMMNSTTLSNDPLKEDFRKFLFAVWKHLNLPDPTPVQYDIAQWLQHGPKRMVIEAFRGVGKSFVTAAYVLWELYRDPQKRIMVVSASGGRANAFSVMVQRLIKEMPILAHLRARHDQRDSKEAFDVGPAIADQSPSVKSVGITGQLTGSRADIIVADDIEVVNNSDTQTKRDLLSELIKEFDAILKPLKTSRIIYLGTPQTEQSIYNRLPARGYAVRIWPARMPTEAAMAKYGVSLAPYIKRLSQRISVGSTTDPQRFSNEDLAERELSYGRSGFALQFQLDTSLSDADKYPLKLRDLIVMDVPMFKAPVDVAWAGSPEYTTSDLPTNGLDGDTFQKPMMIDPLWAEFEGSYMQVDPSGRGKDETAIAITKKCKAMIYLTMVKGLKGGYTDSTLELILRTAQKERINVIGIEPNFGDGLFARLLKGKAQETDPTTGKPFYDCGRIEDSAWVNTQKEARIIDTLEPALNQHRVVVDRSCILDDYHSTESDAYSLDEQQRYRFFYQMTRLTRDKGSLANDDRVDAVAGAVGYWTEKMAESTERAAEAHRDELMNRELERIMFAIENPGVDFDQFHSGSSSGLSSIGHLRH